MAQKTIKKKQLNEIIGALSVPDYKCKVKNHFIIRCEKLLKKLNELAIKVNDAIQDIREEYASTEDKTGNFIYEQVTVADKNGSSRTENAGSFKYTHERAKKRDEAIQKLFDEPIDIPTFIIEKEKHTALYKQIFKDYSLTTISSLAGIILDVPLDEEGFVNEEFVLEMTSEEDKSIPIAIGKNGQSEKKETEPATS